LFSLSDTVDLFIFLFPFLYLFTSFLRKSTLLQAVAYGETVGVVKVPSDPSSTLLIKKGTIWRYHNLRIGVVAQHQIDILSSHLNETPLSYINLSSLGKVQVEEVA
jgi:hypothetical protein